MGANNSKTDKRSPEKKRRTPSIKDRVTAKVRGATHDRNKPKDHNSAKTSKQDPHDKQSGGVSIRPRLMAEPIIVPQDLYDRKTAHDSLVKAIREMRNARPEMPGEYTILDSDRFFRFTLALLFQHDPPITKQDQQLLPSQAIPDQDIAFALLAKRFLWEIEPVLLASTGDFRVEHAVWLFVQEYGDELWHADPNKRGHIAPAWRDPYLNFAYVRDSEKLCVHEDEDILDRVFNNIPGFMHNSKILDTDVFWELLAYFEVFEKMWNVEGFLNETTEVWLERFLGRKVAKGPLEKEEHWARECVWFSDASVRQPSTPTYFAAENGRVVWWPRSPYSTTPFALSHRVAGWSFVGLEELSELPDTSLYRRRAARWRLR